MLFFLRVLFTGFTGWVGRAMAAVSLSFDMDLSCATWGEVGVDAVGGYAIKAS